MAQINNTRTIILTAHEIRDLIKTKYGGGQVTFSLQPIEDDGPGYTRYQLSSATVVQTVNEPTVDQFKNIQDVYSLRWLSDFDRSCLMTAEEFRESVDSRCLMDDDGFGRPATSTHRLHFGWNDPDVGEVIRMLDADPRLTHVVWYNK